MKQEIKQVLKGFEEVSFSRFFNGMLVKHREYYTEKSYSGNKKTFGTYDNWTIRTFDDNHIIVYEELAKNLGRKTIKYCLKKGFKK